jgi:hypothetical protein
MRAMRPPDRRPFVLLVVLVVLCAALGAIAQQPPASTGNHVVIITLDGFPGWALDDPYLPVPNLRRLAANGAVARVCAR